MFALLWDDADQYLGFVGVPKPPVAYTTYSFDYVICFYGISVDFFIFHNAQPGYLPPLGASPYTWPNIYKNMKRMDFCVDKFDFLSTRVKCVYLFYVVENYNCMSPFTSLSQVH